MGPGHRVSFHDRVRRGGVQGKRTVLAEEGDVLFALLAFSFDLFAVTVLFELFALGVGHAHTGHVGKGAAPPFRAAGGLGGGGLRHGGLWCRRLSHAVRNLVRRRRGRR